MKSIDRLIKGRYYTVKQSGNVVKWTGVNYAKHYLGNNCTEYNFSNGGFRYDTEIYRDSTRFEINWLNECIKYNEFIPRGNIKNKKLMYEIY